MLISIVVVGMIAIVITYVAQEIHYAAEREQLAWFKLRWDTLDDLSHARDADRLRRRIAGLLASPRLYLRARRLLGPLDLERDDLTAELELIDLTRGEEVMESVGVE